MNNELSKIQIDKLLKAGFSGIDVDIEISLFEYNQIIAVNKNNIFCIYAIQTEQAQDYKFDYTNINLDDLIADLKDIESGFYAYIGANKNKFIAGIQPIYPGNICYAIYSINQYNGLYNDYIRYDYNNINDILNKII